MNIPLIDDPESLGLFTWATMLFAGLITLTESNDIEQRLSIKQWLGIYVINQTAIFVTVVLLILSALCISAKALIPYFLIRACFACFIGGAMLLKKLIQGSLNILP